MLQVDSDSRSTPEIRPHSGTPLRPYSDSGGIKFSYTTRMHYKIENWLSPTVT